MADQLAAGVAGACAAGVWLVDDEDNENVLAGSVLLLGGGYMAWRTFGARVMYAYAVLAILGTTAFLDFELSRQAGILALLVSTGLIAHSVFFRKLKLKGGNDHEQPQRTMP